MNQGLNLKQKFVVVVMDILLLSELTGSIFAGQRYGEEMAGFFLRTFIPLALSTVIIARICIRRLRTPEPLTVN